MMTAGEFSARSRLSPKSLRLYADRGLLKPAFVHAGNGYRYFAVTQLEQARRIILLRGIGMPLSEIAEVLASSGAEASRLVLDYWRRVEHEHAARRELMTSIQHLLTEGTPMVERKFLERDVPSQRVLFVQRSVRLEELGPFRTEAHERVIAHMTNAQACLSGSIFGLFHGHISEESEGLFEYCVPTESPIEPAGDIGLRVTPAQREVYVELTKAEAITPTVIMAHYDIQAWLDQQGLTLSGPAREIWHPNIICDPADDEHVMDVAYPFQAC